MSLLRRLHSEFGQSPWLDNLRRGWITDGQLVALRDRGVRGLTSNPTIFQKAIQGSSDYDAQFASLSRANIAPVDAYWEMVLRDIDAALDVFAPVYAASDGADGFVSVEVDPGLANDGTGTLLAARLLHERVARRNVMIKIPATMEGLPAIRQLTAEGVSVNVTLIFSLERYSAVIEAFLNGLEERAATTNANLSDVASVGSFFISRVDSEVDSRLVTIGSDRAQALTGKAAVAQARLAYELFGERFSGPRWEALASRGARPQRPLWASTSTKNPAYPDTMYVDELIGPQSVNTLPDPTLEAFDHHGTLSRTVEMRLDEAHKVWNELHDTGIDMSDVAAKLERDGVASFQSSFRELLTALAEKAANTTGS
ncbi:MAG: transaldolase [Ilumatobacteraceae bacterium]